MPGQPSGSPLTPTFQGFIGSTMDALILFEATLRGILSHVPRRPHDRERSQLIRSGNVFIYEEHSSGIKRWTDGVPWSPSRILGNFLLYRELDKPFQPGEKKRAMKRNKTEGVTKHTANPRANSIGAFGPGAIPSHGMISAENAMNVTEAERAYIGSLVDSYQFKEDGLIKKTISVTHKGVQHHLVSYYSLEDIRLRRLRTVRQTPGLRDIAVSASLLGCGSFRAPIDDNDFSMMDDGQFMAYAAPMDYSVLHPHPLPPTRSLSIPSTQPYGHSPSWDTPPYGHNADYTVPQMMQPAPTNYGQQQLLSPYPYEPSYATPSRTPNFNSAMQPTRRHSTVPSSSGTGQLGYSAAAPLLTNGSGLTTHGLSGSPYINGDMFGVSAANAVTEGASTGSSGGNDVAGMIDHRNGTNGIHTPAPHNMSRFDGQLSNGYETPMSRLALTGFGGVLHDSAGSNFGPTSPGTSPDNIALGLDPDGVPSPDAAENPNDIEWNRTMLKNGDQW
ncbi:Gti1/Pac2 family-domain-containing protein [Xylaria castorea]|nr:Gti1/Pac2 family-domain-containing protein [Xylaria castorea]